MACARRHSRIPLCVAGGLGFRVVVWGLKDEGLNLNVAAWVGDAGAGALTGVTGAAGSINVGCRGGILAHSKHAVVTMPGKMALFRAVE